LLEASLIHTNIKLITAKQAYAQYKQGQLPNKFSNTFKHKRTNESLPFSDIVEKSKERRHNVHIDQNMRFK